MRTTEYVVRSLAIVFAAILTACGDSPIAPPPPTVGQPNPVTAVSRVEITGPGEMPPGSTQQFRATAHFVDGTSRDVTNDALWISSRVGVLTVARGLATSGPTLGESRIRASFNGPFGESDVIVVPPGTYRVMGMVTEAAGNGYGVSDAQVEAATPAGVLSTRTLVTGEYRLYGVAGVTEVRVTKTGYQPLVRSINMARHDRVDLELRFEQTRPNLAGTYALTIAADPACGSQLPDDVMSRRYTAVITQKGPQLTVKLQGGTFANEISGVRDKFLGSVETGRPEFRLQDFFDDGLCGVSGPSHECFFVADVVEELGASTYFNPTGTVVATESGSTISGALDGTIYVRGPQASKYPVTASCKSSSHRFTLSK